MRRFMLAMQWFAFNGNEYGSNAQKNYTSSNHFQFEILMMLKKKKNCRCEKKKTIDT